MMSRIQDIVRGTSLVSKPSQGLAIFTICSNNYVQMARILITSAQRFHPEATIYLCLADALVTEPDFYPAGCTVVAAEMLGIPDFAAFVFRYDVLELNTAVKPSMFQHLLAAGHDTVLYFDADIEVFSRLEQVLTPLRTGASFVVTPHLCAPSEGGAFPDDIDIMRAGVYNLGFLGVRAADETDAILAWWARRLQYQCVSDMNAGVFVDQKFMDLLPGFAEHVHVLRDPTVNVAYWNLPQRTLGLNDDGWTVDGRPLGFFHFSGFNPARMHRLSKYTDGFQQDAIPPPLLRLIQHYAGQLIANGHGGIPAGLYAFGRFASGTRVPDIARKMFRDKHIAWSGDPFHSYEAHLRAPMPGQWAGSSAAIVTNLMGYLHEREAHLQRSFDLSTPAGVDGYVSWFVREGEPYIEHCGLTEPVAERLGRKLGGPARLPPAKRSLNEADINVVGYLRANLGLGEAGRLTLRSLAHAGLRARGLETWLNSNSKRGDRSVDHLLDSEANGRFQLFSINCDQLPQVIDHLGPALRPDAYRIMAPFWELSNLPTAWLAAVDAVDEIWAPTGFIQAMLVKQVRKPVIRMPLTLDFALPALLGRGRFRLPGDSFLFFFAFDYFSFVERKNPLAVIKAFKRAFRGKGGHHQVQLVLKTLNAEEAPQSSYALRELVRDDPDIILIENNLPRDETLALIAACDAVVTLHRSEGLGLLVAEAMVLGKPVISTDYSATTELVTPDTGWPVDYRLIPVHDGQYPFHEGQVWADADTDHAAWQMRRVVDNPAEAARRCEAARAMITREYGIDVVAGRQSRRLRSLEGQ